jgi:hypothetical protein
VKAFLAACLEAIVLAAISLIVLNYVQEPTDRAFATPPYIGSATAQQGRGKYRQVPELSAPKRN